jgi:hypothetical protein
MEKRGLGDVIAGITKAVGIEPCESCEKRRDKLNKLFPFKKPLELTIDEFNFLASVFAWYDGLPLTELQANDVMKCEAIWIRVFKVKSGACRSCGSYYQTAYMNDLKRLYEGLRLS